MHSSICSDCIKVTNKTLTTKENYKHHQWRDLLELCLNHDSWVKKEDSLECPQFQGSLGFLIPVIFFCIDPNSPTFDLKPGQRQYKTQGLSKESSCFGTTDELGESVQCCLASTKLYPRWLWLLLKIGNTGQASATLSPKVKRIYDISRAVIVTM